MTKTREDKVKEFRDLAGKKDFNGAPDDAGMIHDCIFEEFIEFVDSAYDFEDALKTGLTWANELTLADKRAALVKEWADLQYVVSQAALYYMIPADEAFDRVHESNMTKVVEGKLIFREDGKILKPDTYKAPDMRGL